MCKHIAEAVQHPRVRAIAARTAGAWGRGPRESRICWDVFWFCKHHVRFMIDEHAVLGLYGETDQIDFLITPPVLLAMKRPAGDCDDFTMLACALLEANGVPWEIVTVATERADPRRWSHVYCRAVLPDGRRLAHGPDERRVSRLGSPGIRCPSKAVLEYARAAGRRAGIDKGADAYAWLRRSLRPGLRATARHGRSVTVRAKCRLRGAHSRRIGSVRLRHGYHSIRRIRTGIPVCGGPAAGSGAGTSVNWNQLFTQLGSIGTRLGSMALLPSGSSLLPSGAVISPSGAATGLLTSGSVGGISLTSVLLIGGAGFAFLMIARETRNRMVEAVQVVVFVVCALGVILYSLPPEIGGPPL